ncbi:MAG: PQQ-binding-like beta-propeller repeat protein [Candidatus Latescibacteria bacterium]|nr:PQQ-binding-like beta-propeller repeat protein [Candidatus Latescibacterota bacterium]
MNEKAIHIISTAGTMILGLLVMTWFLTTNPVKNLVELVPGMDNRPASISTDREKVAIGALYKAFDGIPSEIKGSWPRFRGVDYNNISSEDIRLADEWSNTGPPVLWSVDLGEGHAGPIVANGRVYLLDYDEEKRADFLRCFSFDDGKEIWRRGYDVFIKRNHGMSRTVPAATDKFIVTIGPKCQVMCVDADTGAFRWGIDLEKEYGAEIPLWYTGQCPLIDNSIAVIAVGGKSLIIAVDCVTGTVVWETPNPNDWKMSHSSIIPYTIHGRKMYVYCALGGIAGISAEDDSAGKILFETDLWNKNVIAPSPVYLGNGKLFVTSGYGSGSMMLNIRAENNTFVVEPVQEIKPGEGICSEQQTPLYYDGHLFCILPKDAGPMRNQFVCYLPDDIGRLVWSSGTTHRFGLGPYLVADDKFFILSDEGVLTVMKANTKEPIILTQAKILNGHDAWGPMALVNGRLLARDSRRLVCVDIRALDR